MTITRHSGFAILPKRCYYCNRLYWLEEYDTEYVWFGVDGCYVTKCLECIKKEKGKAVQNDIQSD